MRRSDRRRPRRILVLAAQGAARRSPLWLLSCQTVRTLTMTWAMPVEFSLLNRPGEF